MTVQSSNVDPITMEVVQNALGAIADEMALVIMRTAYSTIVRDSMDYSTGVCDRQGRIVAHGMTMALHLGSFPDAMAALIRDYGDDMHPGDMFIWNDPYSGGGQHLPDVYIVKPVFAGDELEGFAASLVHQIDMGGIAPGSAAVYAREIFQEGLRIPPIKLYERGEPNRTFFKLMEKNTRIPDKLSGDMRAQVAACRTADAALTSLIERYGSGTYRKIVEELHDHAERIMRTEISALPDGTWSFTDYIDGLGEAPEPIPLKVTITIDGGNMTLDWTGSAQQVDAAINCPVPFVKSACHLIVKCLAEEEIPNFEGFIRPLNIIVPEGTIVNPLPPAACAARAIVGWRSLDLLLGCFAQIVPDRVPAAGEGGVTFPSFSGYDGDDRFVCTEAWAGCWGALPDRDGAFGIPNPGGNLTNQPVEMVEALFPLEITRYGMVENSGGPGKHRGSNAYQREYRFLSDETQMVMRSDRRRFLPYGLEGGRAGTPSWNLRNTGTSEQGAIPVMPMEPVIFATGETFRHVSGGGGGHGDPLDRAPEDVLEDVLEERFTAEYARDVYGVVLTGTPFDIDRAETDRHRIELRNSVADAEHPAYLTYFHDALGIHEFRLVGEREMES
ncbi:MAG TPA: 5-oxoprolinase [Rhodospirillaceae bacterium]|nr:5-oxoprolinase [Rhodospirillaceae bacterium]|tara:strand:+ start:4049 stop:5890 length:1842 start_codon:yes stop_codon:yes gene_type:complete